MYYRRVNSSPRNVGISPSQVGSTVAENSPSSIYSASPTISVRTITKSRTNRDTRVNRHETPGRPQVSEGLGIDFGGFPGHIGVQKSTQNISAYKPEASQICKLAPPVSSDEETDLDGESEGEALLDEELRTRHRSANSDCHPHHKPSANAPALSTSLVAGAVYRDNVNSCFNLPSFIDTFLSDLLEAQNLSRAGSVTPENSCASIQSLASSTSPPSTHTTSSAKSSNAVSQQYSYYTPTRKSSRDKILSASRRRVASGSHDRYLSGQQSPSNRLKTLRISKGITPPALASSASFLSTRSRSAILGIVSPTRPVYFAVDESQSIRPFVAKRVLRRHDHPNCTDYINVESAHQDKDAMSSSVSSEERQKIINNNRSIRSIKNDLENLLESGVISDEAFDRIMSNLPAEASLNGSSARNITPQPQPSPAPVTSMSNLNLNSNSPPPSYKAPPALPGRNPSAPPAKAEIARATALYRYAEAGDCNFEVGDEIAVHEYMNSDWWLGTNLRTQQEGVFPANYVQQKNKPSPGGPQLYGSEKTGFGGYQAPQQQGPPPPGPSNPYNSAVPPMQIAEQPSENRPGKGQEMGKKFGKKLGNAAIFGAGATIGGNIVNSIF